ncbi:MAG: glycoside hydrolase family 9 protein [Bacteroidales bacterium]|nr:glycoside hydrolase family 9 protein [Bacteroidales bacterium]
MNKPILSLAAVALLAASCQHVAHDTPEKLIQVDQCGYRPAAEKMALLTAPGKSFAVVDEQSNVVYEGKVADAQYWPEAGDSVRQIVFTDVRTPGKYKIVVDGSLESYPFTIADDAYADALRAAVRALYYNRASMAIDEAHGGKWARPAGHPDTCVLIHKSAASEARPEGSVISSPGGWYDAGDYNKYIVNSSISTYTLMLAARLYPEVAQALSVGIPESGNGIPDLVNETLYNLRWMLTMQDPNDGGVYHKLTTLSFEGFIMPADCHGTRYVVAKGTAAALDLAATAAFAARSLPKVSEKLVPLADSCRNVALRAYAWAEKNPNVEFKNPEDVSTGEYGDSKLDDEWLWAATEMYLTFGDDKYADEAQKHKGDYGVPAWGEVGMLAYFSMLAEDCCLPSFDAAAAVSAVADSLLAVESQSPVSLSLAFYDWGSNSSVVNEAMTKLVLASSCADKAAALKASAANDLHYIFGRNAVGYSFVTGVGSRPPMNIHHRPSSADGIVEPVPGFLAGGPNTVVPDDCGISTRSQYPAAAYGDQECSYSTNEIAINWNAPLVFALMGLAK